MTIKKGAHVAPFFFLFFFVGITYLFADFARETAEHDTS